MQNLLLINAGDNIIITEKLNGISCSYSKFVCKSKSDVSLVKIARKYFDNKLHKGETVYFELVGYMNGSLVKKPYDNSKLEPFMFPGGYGDFIKRYGKKSKFHYGCTNSYKIYVYRITHTDSDNIITDYSWQQVKSRCKQIGVKHVPEMNNIEISEDTSFVPAERESVLDLAEYQCNSESSNFPDHLKEGVCIRIENEDHDPILLKHKSFFFCVLDNSINETNDYNEIIYEMVNTNEKCIY